MLQRRIWWAFVLVLAAGIAGSVLIVYWGNSVQKANRVFIAEKLPLSLMDTRGIQAGRLAITRLPETAATVNETSASFVPDR